MADNTVIIDIEVSDDQAKAAIKAATAEVVRLKEAQRDLNSEYKDGKKTREEYASELADIKRQMSQQNSVIKANEKAMRDNAKAAQEAEGSLNQMRTQLGKLEKQWAALSKEEREGARGQEMLKKMQSLNSEVSGLEHSMGNWHRQVGNYQQAILGLTGPLGMVANLFQGLSAGTGKISVAFQNGTRAVAAFGKQLLSLLTNPIVAIIGAIAVVVMKLVDAFKRSDNAMTDLKTAFAAFSPIVEGVRFVLEKVAETLGKVVLGIANAVTAIGRLIPAFRDAQDAAQAYERDLDALQDAEREYTVESAKNSRDIAELRAKSAESDKYSNEERLGFMTRAIELERANLKQEKDLAAERLRLARQKAKQEKDTTDETKNRLADLEAAMYKAEESFYSGIRRMNSQAATLRQQILKEEEDAQKEREKKAQQWAERQRQMRQLEVQYYRAYQQAIIDVMAEGAEKEIAQARETYDQRRAELEKTLKEEKNLTEQARADINATLVLMETKLQTDIAAIQKKWKDKAEKEEAARKKQLEADSKAQQQAAMDAERQNYEMEQDSLLLIYEQRLQKAAGDAKLAAEANLELQRGYAQQLDEIDNLTYEARAQRLQALGMSEQQFQIARIKAANNVMQAEKDVTAANRANAVANLQAAADITAAFNDMLQSVASGNEKLQGFLKAVALANVATSTAVSIANAIQGATTAAAQTGVAAPFTTPVFIAEMVGIVLSAIGQAASILASNKTPAAPAFAEGGLVEGPGTGTSDSIPARLSNGEAVINAAAVKATAPMLSAINQMYGGAPIGGDSSIASQDAMAEMMREAMREVQPVVSVREILSVSNRVKVKELIAKK